MRALVQLILSLLGISFLTFLVLAYAPGSPLDKIQQRWEESSGRSLTSDAKQQLEKSVFPHSVGRRYEDWLKGVLRGDLGVTYWGRQSVSALIFQALKVTAPFFFASLLGFIFFSIAIGLSAAAQPSLSKLCFGLLGFLACLPTPLLAVYLLRGGNSAVWTGAMFGHLIASLFTGVSLLWRQLKQEQGTDHYRFAKAKGLSTSRLLWKHALPRSCLALLSGLTFWFNCFIATSLTLEPSFSYPGVGRLFYDALREQELVLALTLILLFALIHAVLGAIRDGFASWFLPGSSRPLA